MIRFDRVSLGQADRLVIDDLSLTAPPGTALALLGLTGAGRSSLLAAAATALPLTGGDILVHGHSVRREPDAVRRLVGYVPTHLSAWPAARADDFLELSAVMAGLSGKPLRLAIQQALELAGLEAGGATRIDTLPEGSARRLLLARALVHGPQVLLLDDPFAGLDPVGRADVERLIGDAALIGRTVVAALDEPLLSDCFTHIAVIAAGRVATQGSATPAAFSAGRTWNHRIACPGSAEAAAETVRPFVEEVHIVDGGTIDCRLDSARTACAKVVEALVRSGIAVESVAFHPPWAAQLLAPRSP